MSDSDIPNSALYWDLSSLISRCALSLISLYEFRDNISNSLILRSYCVCVSVIWVVAYFFALAFNKALPLWDMGVLENISLSICLRLRAISLPITTWSRRRGVSSAGSLSKSGWGPGSGRSGPPKLGSGSPTCSGSGTGSGSGTSPAGLGLSPGSESEEPWLDGGLGGFPIGGLSGRGFPSSRLLGSVSLLLLAGGPGPTRGSITDKRSSCESTPSMSKNLVSIMGSIISSASSFPRKGLQCFTAACRVWKGLISPRCINRKRLGSL